MGLTLGEKLRQAREARGMTINQIAEQTRISASYIECMERDDYSCLPGGVFNKGFVKLYARCVGLDEQEALQDYARLMSQQNKTEEQKLYKRSEVFIDDNQTPSKLTTIIVGVVALGLVILGVIVLIGYFESAKRPQTISGQNSNQEQISIKNSVTPEKSLDEIRLEFKVSAPKVWIEVVADGRKVMKEITSEKPESYTAKESLRVRYYKGFADSVKLTLNEKPIKPPQPLQNRNIIEFEINKQNLSQILQSGQIEIAGTKKVQK
jgi:cytoskeletal protein RodZ